MTPHDDTPRAAAINADIDAHREARDALPWLANGTLAGAELARVRAHVDGCADCRADLAGLQALRAAGARHFAAPGSDAKIDVDVALDMESALARLLPQLDTAVQEPGPERLRPVRADPQPMPTGWRARLAANDGRWLRTAAALQCGVIAVLAVLLLRPSAGADAGAYRALGAGPGVPASLVVPFKPETPERELRRIVLAGGARIVGGPTPTGAWLLATDAAPPKVAAQLRTQAAVTLAEPLAAEASP